MTRPLQHAGLCIIKSFTDYRSEFEKYIYSSLDLLTAEKYGIALQFCILLVVNQIPINYGG